MTVRVVRSAAIRVVQGTATVRVTAAQPVRVITAGRGLPGPAGSNGTIAIDKTALVNIPAHLVVKGSGDTGVVTVDPANPADAGLAIGITTTAALIGASVTVQAGGEIADPGWNWSPDLVLFASAGGGLTQLRPTSGWSQVVAVAVASDRIVVGLRTPIQLI